MGAPDLAEWIPRKGRADPARFAEGRIGPLRLGPELRASPFGRVRLALHDHLEEVVEVERYDALKGTGPEGAADLMTDIGRVVGLTHRHLARVTGAGLVDRAPYVVRTHHLGRTFDEALRRAGAVAPDLAAAVLFGVADALAYLDGEGPQPGSCAHGGFEAQDILLGFDGSILLLGAGLQRARGGSDPIERDAAAVEALAADLDPSGALPDLLAGAETTLTQATLLRRHAREACGHRASLVGAWLREHFSEEILEERARFGLATFH